MTLLIRILTIDFGELGIEVHGRNRESRTVDLALVDIVAHSESVVFHGVWLLRLGLFLVLGLNGLRPVLSYGSRRAFPPHHDGLGDAFSLTDVKGA